MKVDGACHCGKIAYEAEVEPGKAIICHCTDCQKLTGSAYRPTIHARAETFVLKGQPKIYINQRAALGPPCRQMWCASALLWSMNLSAIPKYDRQ
jgi:hypothetical protein